RTTSSPSLPLSLSSPAYRARRQLPSSLPGRRRPRRETPRLPSSFAGSSSFSDPAHDPEGRSSFLLGDEFDLLVIHLDDIVLRLDELLDSHLAGVVRRRFGDLILAVPDLDLGARFRLPGMVEHDQL